jgi:hypothetical protein
MEMTAAQMYAEKVAEYIEEERKERGLWWHQHFSGGGRRGYFTYWNEPLTKKDGSPHPTRFTTQMASYTPFRECQLCGFRHGPRKVHERSCIYGWDLEVQHDRGSKTMLCTGCWNKARAVIRLNDEAYALKRQMNALQKAYRQARREDSQTTGAIA